MANDLLALILRANLALAAGIVAVLALRLAARRSFGARIAYGLWALPLFTMLACFLPARTLLITLPETFATAPLPNAPTSGPAAAGGLDPRWLLALWVAGVAASLIVLILRQTRFARALGHLRHRADLGEGVLAAESNRHGPAVLGVLRPVIVTPCDFEQRFSDDERRFVLAHERAHMAQGDPLINAVAAALQCVNWFNPFVHIGARALRGDQELACDAAVLTSANARAYAQAILKTQVAAAAPIGCAWPSPSLALLKERIAMLKHNLPTRTQRIIGVSAVGLASFTACAVAWAAQPAHVVVSPSHPTVTATPTPLPPEPLAPVLYGAPGHPPSVAPPAPPEPAANPVPAPDASADAEDRGDADNDHADRDDDSADDAAAEAALAGANAGDDNAVIVDDNGHVSHRPLTAEERAHIHAIVQHAMAAQHAAMARARVAMRAARAEQAQAHAAAMLDMPQMHAEIAAIEAEAERLATLEANSAEREALRAEIEAHAQRIRAMADQMRRAHRMDQGPNPPNN
jgi:beta-lactamase regulating signal transducer with metallopeptidase domain